MFLLRRTHTSHDPAHAAPSAASDAAAAPSDAAAASDAASLADWSLEDLVCTRVLVLETLVGFRADATVLAAATAVQRAARRRARAVATARRRARAVVAALRTWHARAARPARLARRARAHALAHAARPRAALLRTWHARTVGEALAAAYHARAAETVATCVLRARFLRRAAAARVIQRRTRATVAEALATRRALRQARARARALADELARTRAALREARASWVVSSTVRRRHDWG